MAPKEQTQLSKRHGHAQLMPDHKARQADPGLLLHRNDTCNKKAAIFYTDTKLIKP